MSYYNSNGTYTGRGTRTRLRKSVGHAKGDGFSLRENLIRQGVTGSELTAHLNKINSILEEVPSANIKRYRVR